MVTVVLMSEWWRGSGDCGVDVWWRGSGDCCVDV